MIIINLNIERPIITPTLCVIPSHYGEDMSGAWLEDALPLEAAWISTVPEIREIAEIITEELIESIKASGSLKKLESKKSLSKLKEAIKIVLLNLYRAFLLGRPIRYSRDRSYYSLDRRYGKIYMKYDRILAVVDSLRDCGYIHQKEAFRDLGKQFGRQTRIWASPMLLELFETMLFKHMKIFVKEEREELIELRGKKASKKERPRPIPYQDTTETESMRENLRLYNTFIDESQVMVELNEDTPISLDELENLVYLSNVSGSIEISKLVVDTRYITLGKEDRVEEDRYSRENSTCRPMSQNFFDIEYVFEELNHQYSYSIDREKEKSTVEIRDDKAVYQALLSIIIEKHLFLNRKKSGKDKKALRAANLEKKTLLDFGIRSLSLEIKSKHLYRVFNENFDKGGRHYGAFHQVMPKEFRKHININSEDTVELDYSALHLRMAYHLSDLDYDGDPYTVLTNYSNERDIFKLLALVAINAETEQSAIKGFRKNAFEIARKKAFKDSINGGRKKVLTEYLGIELTDASIKELLERLRKVHYRIEGFIHSGEGLKLQKLDSQIADGILQRLMKLNIPCLPVFDSFIVPKQYEDILMHIMIKEYEKVMDFKPVIG